MRTRLILAITSITIVGLAGVGVASAANPPVPPRRMSAPASPPASPPHTGPQFVSVCRYTHSAGDDPIVKPGQPGASHEHDFLANASTNAFSTYDSLRAAPSACARGGDTAAYWVPSLQDGGRTVRPSHVRAYYLPAGKDPASIKPPPAGLKVVAGNDTRVVRWACVGGAGAGAGSVTVPSCPTGTELVMRIAFPDCWDGVHLDSPDHKAHLAYGARGRCPAGYSVAIPRLLLGVHYPGADGGSDVTLSSGGPETAHADFFNAWDQPVLDALVRNCINAGVHCGATGTG
jgi:hypothetical protein